MSRIGNARRCAGSRMWLWILLCWVALSGTAIAQCEYSSVSGSGLYRWDSDVFYANPGGGSGSLTVCFTSTRCTWGLSSASPVSFAGATSGTASSALVTVRFSVAAKSSTSEGRRFQLREFSRSLRRAQYSALRHVIDDDIRSGATSARMSADDRKGLRSGSVS